jgi:hypothetical protein
VTIFHFFLRMTFKFFAVLVGGGVVLKIKVQGRSGTQFQVERSGTQFQVERPF